VRWSDVRRAVRRADVRRQRGYGRLGAWQLTSSP
jgi:hypothetical protein